MYIFLHGEILRFLRYNRSSIKADTSDPKDTVGVWPGKKKQKQKLHLVFIDKDGKNGINISASSVPEYVFFTRTMQP